VVPPITGSDAATTRGRIVVDTIDSAVVQTVADSQDATREVGDVGQCSRGSKKIMVEAVGEVGHQCSRESNKVVVEPVDGSTRGRTVVEAGPHDGKIEERLHCEL